jgi:hypothetical protein
VRRQLAAQEKAAETLRSARNAAEAAAAQMAQQLDAAAGASGRAEAQVGLGCLMLFHAAVTELCCWPSCLLKCCAPADLLTWSQTA